MAHLETRVSGDKVDRIMRKLGSVIGLELRLRGLLVAYGSYGIIVGLACNIYVQTLSLFIAV